MSRVTKWKTALSFALAVLAVLAIFTIYQTSRINDYKTQLNSKYDRSFYEMVGYVSNVESLLIKSIVTSTPAKMTNFLEETWRNAALAQTILTELPLADNVLSDVSKFLIQVGDYSYTLSVQSAKGQALSEDQYKQLEEMEKYAFELNESLGTIMNDMEEGKITWDKLEKAGDEVDGLSVNNLIKTFAEYPTLIYDGPFSDHIPEVQPKGVTGEEITKEEAVRKVKEFFTEETVSEAECYDDTEDNIIDVFRFMVSFENTDDTAYIDITKKGGHVYWALKSREIRVSRLTAEDAKKKGMDFLVKMGFRDMKDSYFIKDNGIVTVNYIYHGNDVKYYPDMIKVKVALDTGEIIGFDAKGYLYSHADREKPVTKLSLEQAKEKVNTNLEISSSSLAVIPTEFKTEVLVYEFIGKMNEKDLLVYINTETGEEEDVLIILDTDQGILTE